MSLWAGQGRPLATSRPAAALVRDLVAETRAALDRLAGAGAGPARDR